MRCYQVVKEHPAELFLTASVTDIHISSNVASYQIHIVGPASTTLAQHRTSTESMLAGVTTVPN